MRVYCRKNRSRPQGEVPSERDKEYRRIMSGVGEHVEELVDEPSPSATAVPAFNSSVGKAYDELKQGEPAVERLFDLMRFTSKVIEKPNAVDLADVTGDIKFCGVTFKYGDNKPPVLDRLDLHIKAGERIALIGPSGGGKTTLTKLLLRLYDPSSGHILVDDRDIQDVTLRSLRDRIVLVSQDIMLFSGTVAENIGYRDLVGTINRERVKHAATVANADEFIRNLTHGYETNIGQRGSLLSGGQRQRFL